ncbi:hypothetical protein EYF80_045222 [Liparis tanakae]|uniref:Uncharacterized protein n=1 Tax=Liparis tanakae TaxID=230148 RepID=A0A4Z2FUM3_9TELE|nr:hypothetical protein EYF80_045222 [Liparis tanakae]
MSIICQELIFSSSHRVRSARRTEPSRAVNVSTEKYKRDQEKLQEEWLKDQEEVARSADQQEVTTHFNRSSEPGAAGGREQEQEQELCADGVNDSGRC